MHRRHRQHRVALLAEGVDRNEKKYKEVTGKSVALLAEGVDRNIAESPAIKLCPVVALLAEGVDRNMVVAPGSWDMTGRPPRGGRG